MTQPIHRPIEPEIPHREPPEPPKKPEFEPQPIHEEPDETPPEPDYPHTPNGPTPSDQPISISTLSGPPVTSTMST